jgi:hypothetical protein
MLTFKVPVGRIENISFIKNEDFGCVYFTSGRILDWGDIRPLGEGINFG